LRGLISHRRGKRRLGKIYQDAIVFGMATSQQLLTQIDAAIEALLTGGHSQYSIGSRSVTKLDLPSLFNERRMLQSEVARDANGMIRLAKMARTSK